MAALEAEVNLETVFSVGFEKMSVALSSEEHLGSFAPKFLSDLQELVRMSSIYVQSARDDALKRGSDSELRKKCLEDRDILHAHALKILTELIESMHVTSRADFKQKIKPLIDFHLELDSIRVDFGEPAVIKIGPQHKGIKVLLETLDDKIRFQKKSS